MEMIQASDIDFSKLKKHDSQGCNSTIYEADPDGDWLYKMFEGLTVLELMELKRKFLQMSGLMLDDAIIPYGLILEGERVSGIKLEKFKLSKSFCEHYQRGQSILVSDLFSSVKRASLALRRIHQSGIIVQDLSFANILINDKGDIKYCDLDSCCYKGISSRYYSGYLVPFVRYHRLRDIELSENFDRICMLLGFISLVYGKELDLLTRRRYRLLSNKFQTLENIRPYAEKLYQKRGDIPDIPYLDELIDEKDSGIIPDESRKFDLKFFRR